MNIDAANLPMAGAAMSNSDGSKHDYLVETIEAKIQGVNGKIKAIESDMKLSPQEKEERTKKYEKELGEYQSQLNGAKSAQASAAMTTKSKDGSTPVKPSAENQAENHTDSANISMFAHNVAAYAPVPVPEIPVAQPVQIGEIINAKA